MISAGFGFVEALRKLGVERRVHTAGESKAILDPFQPEKPEDVERLKSLQNDIHDAFKALVRQRRAGKMQGDEAEIFSGAFWTAGQALAKGLIDGLGHMHDILRGKFGDKLLIRIIVPSQGWALRRLGLGIAADLPDALVASLETRALWSRFGL